MEIFKKCEGENLTAHLNQIDPTWYIKLTYEEEELDGSIAFLDKLIKRKKGTTKLCIYRKPTHTNQYLQFNSHHPLHQKLGVVRTLLDRKDAIVTEDDKKTEESNINKALTQCRYPEWSIDKVKVQKQQPKTMKKNTKTDKAKSKGMVVIPYVEGVTERLSRIFKKHRFSTGMKPHRTLCNMLVHPKDKCDPSQTVEAIYKILCKNCP